MAGLCDLIKQGAQGMQSAAGSGVVQNLINVANVFAAADIAIRVGSGGQAGVFDLPGLLDVKGIPCYSPELGDTIYVTPMQWYANGMKCEGLKDPDREELKKRIEKIEQDVKDRTLIKQNKKIPIPPDTPMNPGVKEWFDKQEVNDHYNNPGSPSDGMVFDYAGVLDITLTQSWSSFGRARNYSEPGFYSTSAGAKGEPYPTTSVQVQPGDKLVKKHTVTFDRTDGPYVTETGPPTTYYNRQYHFTTNCFLERNGRPIANVGEYRYTSSWSTLPESHPDWNRFVNIGSIGTGVSIDKADLNWKPTGGPSQRMQIDPPITFPPKKPPEEPCDMGCSCGDIAALLREAKKTNDGLDRLIREIHKAVAAGNFIGAYAFKPEETIEALGKRMYGPGDYFGKGGVVQAKNLIEVVAALVSAHYHRSGLQKFPAKVPTTLIPNPNQAVEAFDKDTTDLQDLASFLKWTFEQQNAALGQYPIEFIKVDDGEEKPIKIWNIEHALAEIMGSTWKIQEDADLGLQWGVRSATEASKAGNAAVKSLHAIIELIKATGLVTGRGLQEVSCTFNPNPNPLPQKVPTQEEMLAPTKQQLDVINIDDGRTIMQLLLNINYWCQKAGLAVSGDLSVNPATGKPNLPGDQIKADKKKSKSDDNAWEEWLKLQKNPKPIAKENLPPDHQQAEIKDIKQ